MAGIATKDEGGSYAGVKLMPKWESESWRLFNAKAFDEQSRHNANIHRGLNTIWAHNRALRGSQSVEKFANICKHLTIFQFLLRLYLVPMLASAVAVVYERFGQDYAPPCMHTCSDFQLVSTRELVSIHTRNLTKT